MIRACVTWLTLMSLAAAPLASADEDATITVGGNAEIRVDPDSARFNAAVVITGKDATEALAENNRTVERVLAALRQTLGNAGKGSQDETNIESGHFSIHPAFAPRPPRAEPNWQPEIVGFTVRNQVRVTTHDLSAVGKLLTAANEAGANAIDGLTFDVRDPTEYRARAIKEATRNALADARAAAEAANVKLAKIQRIDVQPTPNVRPLALARAEFAAARTPVPVEPGQVSVSAYVSITMEIEP